MTQRGRPPKLETKILRAVTEALQEDGKPALPTTKGANMRRFMNRYDGAGMGRRLAGWTPPSSGPNSALEGIDRLRSRARDTVRNDWSGNSANQKWSTNLIGIGIVPRFKRVKSKTRRQELVDLWNDFVDQSDADCVLTFYGQQTLAVRSWLEGGEVFIRRRARFEDEDLPVPMQVQLLESEMVPRWDADTYEGLPVGNVIRSGIELNRRGRRIAYWVYKQHPGENMATYGAPTADQLVRVAASEMRHMYEPARVGALRGVSHIAPVMTRLRNIEDYDDATLTRQQIANLWVAFITRALPQMDPDAILNGVTGELLEESPHDIGTGAPLAGLQPGLIQELEDGQDIKFANPPEAGTNYPDYMRTQHLGTAAGVSLPYEIFSGDIKDVSDRTLRVIINEFRRFAEQRQWQIIIPMLCQPVLMWFCDAALLVGKISLDEYDDIRRVEWAPHGWAHIHPVQDPQGKQIEVDAGFRSRSSVISERGDDPDMVDEERAADKERSVALGLEPDPAALAA